MGSDSVVQWVCCNHEQLFTWAAKDASRTRQRLPTGCPQCGRASSINKRQRKSAVLSKVVSSLY